VTATDHLENTGIDAILTKILKKWCRKAKDWTILAQDSANGKLL
jgi:hypothetical protein